MNKLNTNDVDFNFTAHPVTGDISIKSGLDSLKQSLKNILMTSILERPFNTNLNLNINSYLFENFNIYYEDLIKQEITRIIEQYEQRVIINNLILNYKEEQNSLSIQLDFSAINESDINNTVELIVERIR
jgi:phage baseplate assembly protein W